MTPEQHFAARDEAMDRFYTQQRAGLLTEPDKLPKEDLPMKRVTKTVWRDDNDNETLMTFEHGCEEPFIVYTTSANAKKLRALYDAIADALSDVTIDPVGLHAPGEQPAKT